jgi:sulfide dehydrogenase cytochrome subunit
MWYSVKTRHATGKPGRARHFERGKQQKPDHGPLSFNHTVEENVMRFAIPVVPLLGVLGLSACGTTPPPATAPAAKAAEAPKPITPVAAANMANNCFACHGPKGVSPGTIPPLNLMTSQNIVENMQAFKSGSRPSTVMGRHAKAYSDAEINAVAGYIAGLNKK